MPWRFPLSSLARSLGLAIGCALAVLGFVPAPTALAQPAAREEDVKAAYLINFGRFTEWPAGTFRALDDPFVIAVLGADTLAKALEEAAVERRVQERAIVVRLVRTPEDLAGVHLLFVGVHDELRWGRALAELRTQPVFTVGDDVQFARRGGIAAFFVDRERLRFAINRDALTRAHLRVHSRLLNLAVLVEEEPR